MADMDANIRALADHVRTAKLDQRGNERFAVITILVGESDRERLADALLRGLAQTPDRLDIVRKILKLRWPHREDREDLITAFVENKSAGVPGMFYFDVRDAFLIADAIVSDSSTVREQELCNGCLQPAVCKARGGCQGPVVSSPNREGK